MVAGLFSIVVFGWSVVIGDPANLAMLFALAGAVISFVLTLLALLIFGLPAHLILVRMKLNSLWTYLLAAVLVITALNLIPFALSYLGPAPRNPLTALGVWGVASVVAMIATLVAYKVRWPDEPGLEERSD